MRRLICALLAMFSMSVILASGCTGAEKGSAENTHIPQTTPETSAEFPEAAADTSTRKNPENILLKGDYLKCGFYDREAFKNFDETAPAYEISGDLRAGVVTHHLLAGRMIASFFKAAQSRRDIETVVILAPLHYPKDVPYELITSASDWATDFGAVECDRDIAEKFRSELSAAADDEMMVYDHAASAFIPFVKYYLPNAKVSCLLISGTADRGIPEKAAELLYEISGEKNCLFLFSADFCHYSDPDTARNMDAQTLAAVNERDLHTIERMNDSHTDTPRCLCTFIRLMDLLGGEITVLDRSDSADEAGLPYNRGDFPEGVTSYLIFAGETEE